MRQRIVTALFGIPIALVAILVATPWPIGVLAWLAYALCSLELTRIYTGRGGGYFAPSPGFMVFVAAVALVREPQAILVEVGVLGSMWAAGVAGFVLLAKGRRHLAIRVLASFYLFGGLLACVVLQRWGMVGNGAWWNPNLLLMAIVPLWAGDSAAIFVGKALGKHPMAPAISPGKTWEGAVANFLFCLLVALGIGALLSLLWWKGAACGTLSGILGQIGDLLESKLKRSSGLKDSGSILPGHGGVLDRLDSLLMSAMPVAALLLLT